MCVCVCVVVPEVYGRDSRCFEHVWTRDSDSVTGAGDADRSGRGGGGGGRMEMGGDAGCYRHRCSKRRVILSVAGQELRCRVAGQKVRGCLESQVRDER